ncbi:MAG: DUF1598 domain-containing protein [Mariniblastus sp.]|nr:DUF1598 domain-containing protein [Mariniblastus sp.]
MSSFGKTFNIFASLRKLTLALVVVSAVSLVMTSVASAQNFNAFGSVVGGVEINTKGVLDVEREALSNNDRQKLADKLNGTVADLKQAGLRMISLKGLEAAMAEAVQNGTELPLEVQYMAGLQRIEYIIQSPETNDIILAGPGEAFKADEQGNIVGAQSGMPVIHLQDFLVAMRYANNVRGDYEGITVSIDPREQGVANLQKMFSNLNTFNAQHARQAEEVMGPQDISLTGIPKDSRYARTLVSADFKMKRLSMGLEKSPSYLPSLLQMAQAKDTRFRKMAPRFWMECDYQPVAVSDDGNVWKLRGQGVKTLTDEQYFDQDGKKKAKRTENKMAQQWAAGMTDNFEKLSQDEPVFRELRNLMDMSVVSAIIRQDNLVEKLNMDLPGILGHEMVSTPSWNIPQQVPTQCSFVKLSKSWLVTASGGVDVDSFAVAEKTEKVPSIGKMVALASQRSADNWWWNAN